MRNKLIFLGGIGLGYVLGARAGRERYEQIARTARKVKDNPTVQEKTGALQAQASGLLSTAKDTVTDKLGNTSVGAKVSSLLGSDTADNEAYDTPPGVPPRPAGSNGIPPKLDL
jgi:hypothetical protein